MILRQQSGFTLIELMVTVAILAVVAGIAIPLYSGYIQTGYTTECKNEVAAINLAEEEYNLKNQTYFPNPIGTATTTLTDTPGSNPIEVASGGTYVSSYDTATKVQKANCTYSVTSQAAAPYFTITATGANKLAGQGTVYTLTK